VIWVLISTSSPLVSVAVFEDASVLHVLSEEAPMRASGTALRLLEEVLEGIGKEAVEVWAADLGPGSFTGVKVGVTLAKTLAYAMGKRAAGLRRLI
jgi:tRNA threonylcarbamoyladenosine biosynthesis protein TsaB